MKSFWEDRYKTICNNHYCSCKECTRVEKDERQRSEKTGAEIQLRDYNGLKSHGGSECKDKKQMGLVNMYAHKTLRKEREARWYKDFWETGWIEVVMEIGWGHWRSRFRKKKEEDVNTKKISLRVKEGNHSHRNRSTWAYV